MTSTPCPAPHCGDVALQTPGGVEPLRSVNRTPVHTVFASLLGAVEMDWNAHTFSIMNFDPFLEELSVQYVRVSFETFTSSFQIEIEQVAGAAVIPLWGWVSQSCHIEIGCGRWIRTTDLKGMNLES